MTGLQSYSEVQLVWGAIAVGLLVGVVIGGAVKLALGGRTHLGWPAALLSGIFGSYLTLSIVVWLAGGLRHVSPLVALAAALGGTAVLMAIATRLSRRPDPTVAEIVAAGEAADVEFKSTARWNLHTGRRDEKLELVIAKTVAAFANTEGGYLIIGVGDDGEPLGLSEDLSLMKQPDVDRYELWLRDYLSQVIGGTLTASVKVSFPTIQGVRVCAARVPASPRPVFVTPNKGDGPQLWVRVGNSTRQLPLDQALAYASDRFGRRNLRVRS